MSPVACTARPPIACRAETTLPVDAGTALVWSHRLIHWGSEHTGELSERPRQTIAFAMADSSFEAPLLSRESAAAACAPPFAARLALIAHTLVTYHHNVPLPHSHRLALVQGLKRGLGHLSDAALRHTAGSGVGGVLQRNLLALHGEATATLSRAAAAGAAQQASHRRISSSSAA